MSSSIGHKTYLRLLSTCDEILSCMIENGMKIHLVSDSNCNTAKLEFPKQFTRKKNNVGLTFSFVTLYCSLQLVSSKTISIDGTKYHV